MPSKVSEKITPEILWTVGFEYFGYCETKREDLPFSDSAILRAYRARNKAGIFEWPIYKRSSNLEEGY